MKPETRILVVEYNTGEVTLSKTPYPNDINHQSSKAACANLVPYELCGRIL